MSDSASEKRQLSAFWPLVIVLATLIFLQVRGVMQTNEQRAQLVDSIENLQTVEEEAKKIDEALGAVSRDLLTLAPRNHNAQQVVGEFQIKENESLQSSESK